VKAESLERLSRVFQEHDLEWRVQSCGVTSGGKPWAKVLCYVTNRAIMNRLDEVCGPEGWKNEYRDWHQLGSSRPSETSQLCGISIKVGDEWITKWDGAQCSDFEPIKGGLSDAMKRAAVQWGIGRYLYELPVTFADCALTASKQDEDWNYAKDDKGKVFYWRRPRLERIAPHFMPQHEVEKLPPSALDQWDAEIGRAEVWEPVREILLGIYKAYRSGRLDPDGAKPLVRRGLDKGKDVIDVGEIVEFEKAANAMLKDSLVAKEDVLAMMSLARDR